MSLTCWRIPTSEEEIVQVYFEEVIEILEDIDAHLKTWRQHLSDKKALTEIRRAFHTIKGSGRMANVLDLSELAWKVENMLNQVITGVIPASEPMVDLVTTVRNQMPKMVDALKSGHSIGKNGEITGLMIRADILASKKKVAPAPAPRAAAAPLSKETTEFHELNRKLEQCMQRANEALHRSEKALQQARLNAVPRSSQDVAIATQVSPPLNGRRFGWPALILSALIGGAVATGLLLFSVLAFAN